MDNKIIYEGVQEMLGRINKKEETLGYNVGLMLGKNGLKNVSIIRVKTGQTKCHGTHILFSGSIEQIKIFLDGYECGQPD